jgi:hypothetical protein
MPMKSRLELKEMLDNSARGKESGHKYEKLIRSEIMHHEPTASTDKYGRISKAKGVQLMNQLGNLGGLHLDQEEADEFKADKNTRFFNRRHLS